MTNRHNPSNVWITGYRVYEGKALKISMTLNLVDFGDNPQAAMAEIHSFIASEVASGLLPNEPGLEEGERTETIRYVVRAKKRSGEPVVLHLYTDKFNFLKVYIDNEDTALAFYNASGLQFSQLPIWIGGNAPERGADKDTDKFIIAAPQPFRVAWKPNPDYNPDEIDTTKKKPARLFLRYLSDSPQSRSTVPPQSAAAQTVVDKPTPLADGENRQFHVRHLEITKGNSKDSRRLVFKTQEDVNVWAFSRQLFIDAGWIDENEWTQVGYKSDIIDDFNMTIPVKATFNVNKGKDTGYWLVSHVQSVELATEGENTPF